MLVYALLIAIFSVSAQAKWPTTKFSGDCILISNPDSFGKYPYVSTGGFCTYSPSKYGNSSEGTFSVKEEQINKLTQELEKIARHYEQNGFHAPLLNSIEINSKLVYQFEVIPNSFFNMAGTGLQENILGLYVYHKNIGGRLYASSVYKPGEKSENDDILKAGVLAHELMHSVQMSYKEFRERVNEKPASVQWIYEGTAEMAAHYWTKKQDILADTDIPILYQSQRFGRSLHSIVVSGANDAQETYKEGVDTHFFWSFVSQKYFKGTIKFLHTLFQGNNFGGFNAIETIDKNLITAGVKGGIDIAFLDYMATFSRNSTPKEVVEDFIGECQNVEIYLKTVNTPAGRITALFEPLVVTIDDLEPYAGRCFTFNIHNPALTAGNTKLLAHITDDPNFSEGESAPVPFGVISANGEDFYAKRVLENPAEKDQFGFLLKPLRPGKESWRVIVSYLNRKIVQPKTLYIVITAGPMMGFPRF